MIVTEKANVAVKKLENYVQTKPAQLSLFELVNLEEMKKHQIEPRTRSHTVAIYDFAPKYIYKPVEREKGRYGETLPTLKRDFGCGSTDYKITITPARLEGKDGIDREHYPGLREELVEDALRKLACEGQGLFLDDQAGVSFSLYQLQQELKRIGHTYSYDELKDALMICSGTRITITNPDGTAILTSTLFENVGMRTFEEWKEQGTRTKCFVRFNMLVTASIREKTYRLLNYDKAMSYSSVIAFKLHKRLSHFFTWASVTKPPFNILLSTIIRDFGLTEYSELRNNLRDVKKALDEMKNKDVLADYEIEKFYDENRRNKIIDAKILLYPSRAFCYEMIHANEWHQKNRKPVTSLPRKAK